MISYPISYMISLYGMISHLISVFHSITVLHKLEFILSRLDKGVPRYLVTNAMLENVWIRLRDRLSLLRLDSSTSLLEITADYAAHFYDMYVEGHT